jgi:hypothetical protein
MQSSRTQRVCTPTLAIALVSVLALLLLLYNTRSMGKGDATIANDAFMQQLRREIRTQLQPIQSSLQQLTTAVQSVESVASSPRATPADASAAAVEQPRPVTARPKPAVSGPSPAGLRQRTHDANVERKAAATNAWKKRGNNLEQFSCGHCHFVLFDRALCCCQIRPLRADVYVRLRRARWLFW